MAETGGFLKQISGDVLFDPGLQPLGGFAHIPATAPARKTVYNIRFVVGCDTIPGATWEGLFGKEAHPGLAHWVGMSCSLVNKFFKSLKPTVTNPWQLHVHGARFWANGARVGSEHDLHNFVDNMDRIAVV